MTIEDFVRGLNHEDVIVRNITAWKLGRMGPVAVVGAVPALILALGDVDPRVRANAAWALGRMGPAAIDAIPALAAARQDSEELVCVAVIRALAEIAPSD